MHTLLMRLAGPMQSWGTKSQFTERDTELEPSKSGVVGLICAAMGIDRDDWQKLEPITKLRMGVRVDKVGIPSRDYQTAGMAYGGNSRVAIRRAGGGLEKKDVAVSNRYYLADAVFLVGLEGSDPSLLEKIHHKLNDPVWPLYLGRKSYVPSPEVYLPPGSDVPGGLRLNEELETALARYPFLPALTLTDDSQGRFQYTVDKEALKSSPESFQCMIEPKADELQHGSPRLDVPIDAFSKRKFGRRYVASKKLSAQGVGRVLE